MRSKQGLHSQLKASSLIAGLPMRSREYRSLIALNSEFFELFEEQARAQPNPANAVLISEITHRWRRMNPRARQRLVSCPYLLVDAGLSDPKRWAAGSDAPLPATSPPFFTVRRTSDFTRQVLMYAWHVSQLKIGVAQVLIGLPAQCARMIGSYTLSQISQLAGRHADWVRPRWVDLPIFWRGLLASATSGEAIAVESARMHGIQLLAAELQAANVRSAKPTVPSGPDRVAGAGSSQLAPFGFADDADHWGSTGKTSFLRAK